MYKFTNGLVFYTKEDADKAISVGYRLVEEKKKVDPAFFKTNFPKTKEELVLDEIKKLEIQYKKLSKHLLVLWGKEKHLIFIDKCCDFSVVNL